ncbi:hypothetical protein BUALT_Bualt09G0133100 [Buddleja alternifolia]|uniref:Protein LURP-one-related 15 n=1 Tax=Buddleja alternifolia TaxID=168488 RepID=A0AAV6X8X1_9LAMI|nr:hypothetical protein BUALT_Bualt09G0133100 [Buddleja alternifolia]
MSPVISSRFCFPHPIDLTIAEREFGNTFRFGVNDVYGDPIFKVREQFRGRREITDAASRPIVTLRPNILSAYSRWEVFRGQSTEQKNLIFSVKISLMIEFRTKLDVFLANNVMENVCDYKMYKDVTAEGVWIRKQKFMVTVSHFCSPNSIDLTIAKKVFNMTDEKFVVNDVNGNLMFQVIGSFLSFRATRVILDAAGRPIVTLRPKILTAHSRWEVFRGESTEDKNLIFSVKTSSTIGFDTKLYVFLAKNVTEELCDCKVKASWLESTCEVYAGDSSTVIAQMHKELTAGSVSIGKHKFMVTVYPNVDHAFIVALILILDEIKSRKRRRSSNQSH